MAQLTFKNVKVSDLTAEPGISRLYSKKPDGGWVTHELKACSEERLGTTIAHALVGNNYVPGYQVHVHRYTLAPNGVTLLSSIVERVPADRGVTLDEARTLSSQINGGV